MMEGTRPVARLSWNLYVDCPKCDTSFDVVDTDSENDYVIAKKVFSNKWDDVEGCEITCPHCEHEFELGKIEY
jgi:uncharacterized Zn finger protein (UPF0148 family)